MKDIYFAADDKTLACVSDGGKEYCCDIALGPTELTVALEAWITGVLKPWPSEKVEFTAAQESDWEKLLAATVSPGTNYLLNATVRHATFADARVERRIVKYLGRHGNQADAISRARALAWAVRA